MLGYWRDRVTDPLALLAERVNDDNRAGASGGGAQRCRSSTSQAALDVAVESLVHPQDAYLEYTLKETVATLENRVKAQEVIGRSKFERR